MQNPLKRSCLHSLLPDLLATTIKLLANSTKETPISEDSTKIVLINPETLSKARLLLGLPHLVSHPLVLTTTASTVIKTVIDTGMLIRALGDVQII